MFTQKPEEPDEWLGLPSEPFDRDEATDLPERPAVDLFGLGLGATSDASGAVLAGTGTNGSGTLASVSIPLPDSAGAATPEHDDPDAAA